MKLVLGLVELLSPHPTERGEVVLADEVDVIYGDSSGDGPGVVVFLLPVGEEFFSGSFDGVGLFLRISDPLHEGSQRKNARVIFLSVVLVLLLLLRSVEVESQEPGAEVQVPPVLVPERQGGADS
jgi:hypothetical protein